MKQVTIYASRDLERTVVAAIRDCGAETYLTVEGATAHRFNVAHDLPQTMTWEASMFLVPGLTDGQASALSETLHRDCDVAGLRPCLRVTTAEVDTFH
jgi:hypothetical protein